MTAQRADELVFTEVLPIGTPEERALAHAFKSGERDAYRAIHDRYEARVHSVCRRMLHNPEDAAEAAQETFLRVYQGLGTFNGRYRLGAWVVRIATNVCLDQLRASTRRPSDPTPTELLELESAPIEGNDPEILFMRYAEGRKVRKVLESLPPMHRAAIVLRDFEGISYAEIAETLGITDCQVKALLHRARRGFRKTWTTNFASVFAPFVLLKRMFRPVRSDATPHLQAAPQAAEGAVVASSQQVTSVAAQAFQTCSGMIQGCGQFFADKAAPVVTAVVVGTATVGAAAINDRDKGTPAPAVQQQQQMASASTTDAQTDSREASSRPPRVKEVVIVKHKPAAPIEEPPAEEPAAEEPTVTDPVPPPADSGSVTPGVPVDVDPVPPPPPVIPEPVNFAFSFLSDLVGEGEPCACLPAATEVVSSKVAITEANGLVSLDHLTRSVASAAGTPFYGLELRQTSDFGRDHAMDFVLQRPEGMFRYAATGRMDEKSKTEWGGWKYKFSGNYRLYSRPGGSEVVPQWGTYTAELLVSWRQNRILGTNVSLSEGS